MKNNSVRSTLWQSILKAAIEGNLTKHNLLDLSAKSLVNEISKEKEDSIKSNDYINQLEIADISHKKLYDICKLETGSLVVKTECGSGLYPVISGGKIPMGFIDKFNFDGQNITVARCGGAGYVSWHEGKIWVNDKCIILTKINENLISKKYLFYFLMFIQEQIYSTTSGVGSPTISYKNLYNLDIYFPPLEEQARIVAKIKKLEPLIEQYEKEKEKRSTLDFEFLQKLRLSILKAAIKGNLTKRLECTDVDKSLAEMKKEKNNKIIHSNEEEKFDVPSTWRWVCLSNVVKSINAGTDKPEHFSESKNEKFNIPVYGNGEYNDGLIGYTDKATIFEKALTISARGTIGFSKVRNEPFVPIVRLLVLRSLPETNLSWISYALMGLMEYGNGSVIKQLTVPMISHKLIPFPPLEEQKHIVEVLDKIFIKINDLRNIFNQNLNNLNYKK